MKSDILSWVQSCFVCQQAKPNRSKYPGLLQPLPVPDAAWDIVSMDFVEGLPKSGSVNAILVVVDKFTKFSHFVPLHHPFTAASVAKLFMDHIYRLHGMPSAIISDRDRVFTSTFWQTLFKLSGTQLQLSTAYHPQTDGQTERVNQCLETYLRCFVHACPMKWSQWLSLAEFWYNSSFHSSLGRSPFEVLYGYAPRHFGLSADSVGSDIPALSQWLSEREVMQALVKQHLLRAQIRMKRQSDKHHAERVFAMGDWVFLKIQPYVQSSLTHRSHQKLSFRFFGPYQIMERIGPVAYRLALPSTAAIHPVFHVSQLKKSHGDASVTSALPTDDIQFQVPELVLQRRWISGDHPIEQGLIKWSQMPKSLATWESLQQLRQQFPYAPAWGHAGSQEKGDVSTVPNPAHSQQLLPGEPSEARPKRARKPNERFAGPTWVA
jgi:hypothetical protein